MTDNEKNCPRCNNAATAAGTAGKGYGYIYQCNYCAYRWTPKEDLVYDESRITEGYRDYVKSRKIRSYQ